MICQYRLKDDTAKIRGALYMPQETPSWCVMARQRLREDGAEVQDLMGGFWRDADMANRTIGIADIERDTSHPDASDTRAPAE